MTMQTKDLWHSKYRGWRFGVLFNLSALWVGVHYSAFNRRYCINIIPTITVWVTAPGGVTPNCAN